MAAGGSPAGPAEGAASAGARGPATRPRVLVRCHDFGEAVQAAADRLRDCGRPLALVVDETRGAIDTSGFDKVSLTPHAVEALGLWAPDDMGWRCGDYALQVARAAFPDASAFWLIEPDVRLDMADLAAAFDRWDAAAADTLDFVAPFLGPARSDWYWTRTMAAPGVEPWRCLYCVCRASARAVDHLREARRAAAAATPPDPKAWPNDEVFTATTLHADGFRCADLNDLGLGALYTPATLTFDSPISADEFRRPPRERIYHPVLEPDDFRRKVARLDASVDVGARLRRRVRAARAQVARRLDAGGARA